ncbi:MAG: carbamoyltransferase HypF [Cyanobacteria bacterium J06639_1]
MAGAVQGVGFRPFIYRLATDMQLTGWVRNSAAGVDIAIEGMPDHLQTFVQRLRTEPPVPAKIHTLKLEPAEVEGDREFVIQPSGEGRKTALMLPDLATCADCMRELFDPTQRRYRYPFTNCTHCGPRHSIITALPYDRPHTTMRKFTMCPTCQIEYANPRDRRFHAQPNACPECGPQLELWDRQGTVLAARNEALARTAAAIRAGDILAVKGLGGFHLMADARDRRTVERLRQRKHRPVKPIALMVPSLDVARSLCEVSDAEADLLRSPAAPIVILKRRLDSPRAIAPSSIVAPNNPYLGVMLPHTPLHHLLLAELDFPIVATSGNLSGEPICFDEREVRDRLGDIADLFLVHDRPIARPIDDSVVRVVMGQPMMMRRARGYAPLPVGEDLSTDITVLAAGAHQKNTVALSVERRAFLSQHLGDLDTVASVENYRRAVDDLQDPYEARPEAIACDLHPDYRSTHFANQSGLEVVSVQHHHAHVLACMADNQLLGDRDTPVLGIAWGGTGYGTDGTLWGGEFLLIDRQGYRRVAHLHPFRLPGGDRAAREPRRAALGLLHELYGDTLFSMTGLAPIRAFDRADVKIMRVMLQQQINAPLTSSIGRLFDAVAAIADLCPVAQFEGQAAMELEFAAESVDTEHCYPFQLAIPKQFEREAIVVRWQPAIEALVADLRQGRSTEYVASVFHNTLVEMMLAIAERVRQAIAPAGALPVVLTGGCFQNKYLTERAITRLRAAEFAPYWHHRVPPNDGGIALGQLVAATRYLSDEEPTSCA